MPAYTAHSERGYGKYGWLIGYCKGRTGALTVSVDPGSIAGGATGTVNVTVAGARVSRQQRVVMLPPTTLEAGLQVLGTPVTGDDTVQISLLNTTGGAIDGAARNWTARIFSRVP